MMDEGGREPRGEGARKGGEKNDEQHGKTTIKAVG
jgi:hypothetical protein